MHPAERLLGDPLALSQDQQVIRIAADVCDVLESSRAVRAAAIHTGILNPLPRHVGFRFVVCVRYIKRRPTRKGRRK
jgi:hypothetical protein